MIEQEIIINSSETPNDDYAESSNTIKTDLPVSKARAIAQSYLNYISEISDEDDETSREALYSLIENLENQKNQSGTADDFHNFAVALARKDEYMLACRIIAKGLNQFPKNVDLLADFLQYGVNCGRFEECNKYYKTLKKIPCRRWTWRGFAFIIDYLKCLIERTDSEKELCVKEREMLEIVAKFREVFPFNEETYRSEADVYKSLNMHDKELDTLREALKVLNIAPKCALRCADILFERGIFDEATTVIKRCISDATQTQTSVNEGYIYYLLALCMIADYQKNNREITDSVVLEIYSNFNVALTKLSDSSYADVIKTKVETLISKTSIDVPVKYERLVECIAE